MIDKPVALVTGGSRGLGARIVEVLRERGWHVEAPTSREMNVADDQGVHAYIGGRLQDVGRIDALINNAAILGPVGTLESNDRYLWHAALEGNLYGAAQITAYILPHMLASGSGKIINIAGGGATGPLPRRSAYAASKAGLVRLTECVAEEVRDYGIDVNAVLPGPMPTGMVQDMLDAGPQALGLSEYAAHKEVMVASDGDQAITRAAELVAYLASSESDGITGKTISARYDPWPFSEQDKSRLKSSDWLTLRRVDK